MKYIITRKISDHNIRTKDEYGNKLQIYKKY